MKVETSLITITNNQRNFVEDEDSRLNNWEQLGIKPGEAHEAAAAATNGPKSGEYITDAFHQRIWYVCMYISRMSQGL